MHETNTIGQLRGEIRDYLTESFLPNRSLGFDDDLLQALNSLELLRMVLELESRYSISIPNSELTPENFGTLNQVAVFVAASLDSAGYAAEASTT